MGYSEACLDGVVKQFINGTWIATDRICYGQNFIEVIQVDTLFWGASIMAGLILIYLYFGGSNPILRKGENTQK